MINYPPTPLLKGLAQLRGETVETVLTILHKNPLMRTLFLLLKKLLVFIFPTLLPFLHVSWMPLRLLTRLTIGLFLENSVIEKCLFY